MRASGELQRALMRRHAAPRLLCHALRWYPETVSVKDRERGAFRGFDGAQEGQRAQIHLLVGNPGNGGSASSRMCRTDAWGRGWALAGLPDRMLTSIRTVMADGPQTIDRPYVADRLGPGTPSSNNFRRRGNLASGML